MGKPDLIKTALELPNGARFYRCALQVNPFEYLKDQNKPTVFKDEKSYNVAMIQAMKDNGIEVIAVTDHYRVSSALGLLKAAQEARIHAFAGFEASTKDGVHLLCLFDPDRDANSLERLIGACGIHDDKGGSPIGQYDVIEFLQESQKWGAVCIAAHVVLPRGGLLAKLSGQTRVQVWKSPLLLACSVPGSIKEAPENFRQILENTDPAHKRERPIAILDAQDVNSPEDLAKTASSCWIKMSKLSVEGLRQAFLDPRSRIRLASDPLPEEHTEFVAMTWEGGFLDGTAIHFNENLNVLIGGRGTGKSTIVESLRYVLGFEPLGEEARKAHEGIIRQVLKSGTKISLRILSHRPAKHEYLIERTIPNPTVIRDASGKVLNVTPSDIAKAEVYGQHEISELTKSPEKLTKLLDRFVEKDLNLARRKSELKRQLERSRTQIIDNKKELKQAEERLTLLPGLEETLRRFQDAGLEERLKERSQLVREERVIITASDRVSPFKDVLEQLRRALPIDIAFLSPKALEALPGKEVLTEAGVVLEELNKDLKTVVEQLRQALDKADKGLIEVNRHWGERKTNVQAAYEKILRDLQKSKVDGEEFIRLRHQIEELRPLKEHQATLQQALKALEDNRVHLLVEWEDIKTAEFRELDRAAKKVNRQLTGRVKVQVSFAGNREPLYQLLREQIGGRLSEAIEAFKKRETLSLKEFASACRAGRDVVAQKFGISPGQAERFSLSPIEVIMQLEELDLPPTTQIELNVASDEQPPVWQALTALSTGQKATAVLLLLLLESDAPLVVDQPEDDLDNRFITDGVVPKMREEKRKRQFIFATHNANIPVLGDAELILGLSASGEAGQGKAEIPIAHMGSIDDRPVRELVEEILEGGKDAFEMRRLKYGF